MRRFSTGFSLVALLVVDEDISADVRQALREHRLRDAARLLMRQYALSCIEAGNLLNVTACEDNNAESI